METAPISAFSSRVTPTGAMAATPTGSATSARSTQPRYAAPVALASNTGVIAGLGLALTRAVDWDGDGDLDLTVAFYDASIRYYENAGTRTSPRLIDRGLIEADGAPISSAIVFRPDQAFLDLDGDGDLRTITAVRGEVVEGDVKTPRSRRSIDLDPTTVAALKAHQLEQRMLMGAGYTDRYLVFGMPDGAPWNPDVVGRAFTREVERTDLPRIRLHDLRHTHATHLLAAGVNMKLVSERLGHATVGFTLDVYGHVMPGQQADAAAAVAALVDV